MVMRQIEIVVGNDGHRFVGVRDADGRWWHQIGPPTQSDGELGGDVLTVLVFEEPLEDTLD